MRNEFILGMDISTSMVGLSIIDGSGKQHWVGHVDLTKTDDLFKKAGLVRDELQQFKGQVTQVAIEEPLVMFKAGASSAQVISRLAQFNGMVSMMVYREFGLTPAYYNVNTARSRALPKTKFPKGCNRKQVVLDAVAEKFDWLIQLKRTGKPKDYSYDEADSMVIALCHVETMKGWSR
jgi:Holliday junction resolvasome RuvABC endonuclease subunit